MPLSSIVGKGKWLLSKKNFFIEFGRAYRKFAIGKLDSAALLIIN